MEKNNNFNIPWKTCFRVGVSIFILFLALTYWKPLVGLVIRVISAANPVFIGIALAYIINILMSFYEKHFFKKHDNTLVKKIRRPVCLLGALATGIGIVAIIMVIVLPQLIDAITLISRNIPSFLERLSKDSKIMTFLPDGIAQSIRDLDFNAFIAEALNFLQNGIPGGNSSQVAIMSTISSVSSQFMAGFIGFIFSIYILLGKEKLKKQSERVMDAYTGKKFRNKIMPVLEVANESFHSYIVGQVAEAFIIGILCAIGMKIFRFPYAPMIGSIIGLTALIPVLGAYLGAIVGALMIASVAPMKVIPFIIYIVVLQQLEGNLIYPRVVGTSLGLPGLWVLAAVTVGGSVGGILGMLFAVPIFATIYRLVANYVRKSEKENGGEAAAEKLMNKMREP